MSERPVVAFFSEVAPFPPPLSGGQIRVERLIRELLAEFDVALVCQSTVDEQTLMKAWDVAPRLVRIIAAPPPRIERSRDPEWGSLARCGSAAMRYLIPGTRPAAYDALRSSELVSRARALFRDLRIDAVWASRPWMADMARAAGARRILVDIGDFDGRIVAERLARAPAYARKPLHRLQAAHLLRYERAMPARYDAIAACKREDFNLFARGGRARLHVVPNGVDIPVRVSTDARRPFSMLFVGALWYEPNVEALRYFLQEVFPEIRARIPEARIDVAGRGPIAPDLEPILSSPGVEAHESPESLTGFYARASLSVAPLLSGGGTSIKVIESLAFGVPVVATSVATRGLGLSDGVHVRVANTPRELVAACLELLTNTESAQALADAGRAEVARRFSWDQVGVAARDAIRSVLSA